MVSYEDGDYEECDESELIDMIEILEVPPPVVTITCEPTPLEDQLNQSGDTSSGTATATQKRIKKRKRSESSLSEDDEATAMTPNFTSKQCRHWCTLLRRAILMLDELDPAPLDINENIHLLNCQYEEWTARGLEGVVGASVDNKYPHLDKYIRAGPNDVNVEQKTRGPTIPPPKNSGTLELIKKIVPK